MSEHNNNNSNVVFDVFISIAVGIILGIILYRFYICPPIMRGPNSRDIIDKVFEVNGKYYELEPVVCGCIKNKTLITNE